MQNLLISIFGENVGFHLASLGYNLCKLALVGILFWGIEAIRPAQSSKFFKNDFWIELAYPIFNALVSVHFISFLAAATTAYLLTPLLPHYFFESYITNLPFAVQVFLGLLVLDLIVYWEHRFEHSYLWPFHALHHMTEEVSWLTHLRIHPVNAISIKLFNVVLLYMFGFSGDAIVVAMLIIGWVAVFEHANIALAWPKPLCYLIVSPHYHRWHHAKDVAAIDKNFCLLFPFLDLLFGTYYCPEHQPKEYGVFTRAGERAIGSSFISQLVDPFLRLAGFKKKDSKSSDEY